MGQLGKRKSRILRKISGNRWFEGQVRLGSNVELYTKIDHVTTTTNKKNLLFYSYILRMMDD